MGMAKSQMTTLQPFLVPSSLRVDSASSAVDDSSYSQSLSLADSSSADVMVDEDVLQRTISLTQKCSSQNIGESTWLELGPDWGQFGAGIGTGLGPDWGQIGDRLGTNWGPGLGPDWGQIGTGLGLDSYLSRSS